jgi:putative membrane protein
MLVATGVYRRFVGAVADLSRLRLSASAVGSVAIVAGAALLAIALCSALVAEALLQFRWAMYSLFIGLTLGGAPLLWRMVAPWSRAAWAGLVCGAAVMSLLAWAQAGGASGSGGGGWALLLLAGVAGASAMILPGVSGAYLLLLLGQYQAIIEAIRGFTAAAAARDLSGAWSEVATLLPVGVGVLLGIALVSNLLRWLLARFEKATLGALLGLLLAAPLGLYPFMEAVPPQAGTLWRGEILTEASAAAIKPRDWAVVAAPPTTLQVVYSIGLVVLGAGATWGVSRLGATASDPGSPPVEARP